jgi:protein transport protein SEC13
VSWSPVLPQDENHANMNAKRIVSGGCDDTIKIWRFIPHNIRLKSLVFDHFRLQREESNGQWSLEHTLNGHNEWVRDVAWSPNVLHSKTSIASCSQVHVFYQVPIPLEVQTITTIIIII